MSRHLINKIPVAMLWTQRKASNHFAEPMRDLKSAFLYRSYRNVPPWTANGIKCIKTHQTEPHVVGMS